MPLPSQRLRVLSAVIMLFALVLIGKLYWVQIVEGEEYRDRADRQYERPQAGIFGRGGIFFEYRDGNRLAGAALKEGFMLVMKPSALVGQDIESLYTKLSEKIALDRIDFFDRSAKYDDPYEEIAHELDNEAAEKIAAMELPGFSLHKERWRYYPGKKTAAHTIGFLAYNDDELAGRYGLERQYEEILARNTHDALGSFLSEILSFGKKTLRGGVGFEGDITTTIEPTVQVRIEKTIETFNEKWGAEGTGGIILDPQTGEVRALAYTPSFDPNNFRHVRDPRLFSNPLLESVYEMGSIMKPLTVAAGLDAGAITAKTHYEDRGSLEVDGATVSNYDGKARGVVTMQDVLSQSLNTGVAFIVERMGKTEFADYFKKFGLGEETGIDLPGEIPGLIGNLNSPRTLEYITASFGQGIATTPMITARALSALANGGVLPNPYVVKEIEYTSGIRRRITPLPGKRVIKKETADEITRMLVEVVDTALLHGAVKNLHYSIAAKTGTAQIPNPRGGYYENRFLHSFFGYFPASDPQFLIFLYAIAPKASFASETLTTPFIDITKFLINYYEIPPDR